MGVYTNADAQRIRGGGGSIRVTIVDYLGQGNGGTSLPCIGCWISPASGNSGLTKMNIGIAASASLGIELADADTGGGPLWVPIDDVAKLYFYNSDEDDDVIDITYLVGGS